MLAKIRQELGSRRFLMLVKVIKNKIVNSPSHQNTNFILLLHSGHLIYCALNIVDLDQAFTTIRLQFDYIFVIKPVTYFNQQ